MPFVPGQCRPAAAPHARRKFRHFLCTLALRERITHRSPTTSREKLVKNAAMVVHHGRYITYQPARVAIPRAIRGNLSVDQWPSAGARSSVITTGSNACYPLGRPRSGRHWNGALRAHGVLPVGRNDRPTLAPDTGNCRAPPRMRRDSLAGPICDNLFAALIGSYRKFRFGVQNFGGT